MRQKNLGHRRKAIGRRLKTAIGIEELRAYDCDPGIGRLLQVFRYRVDGTRKNYKVVVEEPQIARS